MWTDLAASSIEAWVLWGRALLIHLAMMGCADAVVGGGDADHLVDLLVAAEFLDVVVRLGSAALGPSDDVDLLGAGFAQHAIDEDRGGLGRLADVAGVVNA